MYLKPKTMAKVDYIRPIEALHGKLKKEDKTGFAKRSDSGCKFTVTRDDWRNEIREEKQAAVAALQTKFAAVHRSAVARLTDPTKMSADLEAFGNQDKYPTLLGYLFSQEWKSYVAPAAEGDDE